MKKLTLPPLIAVRAFEAAGRLGSFVAAAEELHVSHPVISHHIKNLEQHLQGKLFERGPRGVALTDAGLRYHKRIASALGTISDAGRIFSEQVVEQRVRLVVIPEFASRWLRRHLPQFRANYPHIKISIEPNATFCEIDPANADLGISFDTRDAFRGEITSLCRPDIFPVCSPAWLARQPKPPSSAAELSTSYLLHEDDGSWWEQWFATQGIVRSVPSDITYLSGDEVIELALAGQGVALVPELLIREELQSGKLIRPVEGAAIIGELQLILPFAPISDATRLFIEWLVATI
jgi:LysR family glycine cleavage system transcriptional activator